ncbi:hypothetical protein BJI67_04015 [Acidihalobacter aeolianus]|uniref:RNA polymerase subunit sigma-24 n=1 Tax=Acidihalobacter aeolianus TaxID=2792603 RepID=A0A1D8K5V9_9GAMM|nr:RNA polymerase sigma factor [Acidihalobacter aeolianus]AOV16346.1 hypothetical protein BJI67_04015 [Acidihalobacter aeolianus]
MNSQRLSKWFTRPLPPDDFEALMAPHVETLYRVAYRFTGHQEDAEDLVQDLLIKLYPKSAELASIDVLRPWLMRALYNLFVDGRRRHARSPHGHLDAHAEHEEDGGCTGVWDRIASDEAGPETSVEHGLLGQHIMEAMEALNEEQKAVLMLHDVEGYSLVELSETLDVPVGTLKSRLFRARRALKDSLMARKVGQRDLYFLDEVMTDELPSLS